MIDTTVRQCTLISYYVCSLVNWPGLIVSTNYVGVIFRIDSAPYMGINDETTCKVPGKFVEVL